MIIAKEKIIEEISHMSEQVDTDDVMEKILLLSKIEKGLEDVSEKRTTSHDDVKGSFSSWLK